VMVFMTGDLIHQMPTPHVGRACQPVFSKEFERAVYGRFGEAGKLPQRPLVHFCGRKMPPTMM
jgi:hypothetical protein